MKNIFLAIFAITTIVSCATMSSSKTKIGGSQVNITGTNWTLEENVRGKKPTLLIEAGKISGNAGCNNYFGQLSLDATVGNFSAKNIGSTRMACDNMSVETNFLNMLSEANKYVVSGTTLELYKDKLLLLKLNKL